MARKRMQALIQHLGLGASIPMAAVARFAADCTRRWMVVELISPEDVQIGVMQSQRNRHDPFLTEQQAAFVTEGFRVLERHLLPTGTRALVLMERTA